MIASSGIEDTDTSSLNTNRGFMKSFRQLHGLDYLSWVVELPPWLVILWSSPGHLSVTRRLCPSKESTFVPEPAHPVNLSALNFKASRITNREQNKAPSRPSSSDSLMRTPTLS